MPSLSASAAPAAPAFRARLTAVLCGLLLAAALAAREVPFHSGRVVDEAGLLSAEAGARLDKRLAALEQETGAHVAVLTIPGLEGEVLEDYSLRVAETWKLGRQDVDDGVLLLVARDDRRMRLEVGYGLEGRLTDLQSHVILDDILQPAFRRGDYEGGLEQGVEAVATALRGGEVVAPAATASSTGTWLHALILALMLGFFSLGALSMPGPPAWIFYAALTFFYYALPLALELPVPHLSRFTAGGWLIGFPILRTWLWRNRKKNPKVAKWFSWTAGGDGSSGGSWSGGSGSSSSGGGGSFGGGGASGSW